MRVMLRAEVKINGNCESGFRIGLYQHPTCFVLLELAPALFHVIGLMAASHAIRWPNSLAQIRGSYRDRGFWFLSRQDRLPRFSRVVEHW